MFDMMPNHTAQRALALFLSNPLGRVHEWAGMADTLGETAVSCAFDRPADLRRTALSAPAGAHVIAHGSGAYHALDLAIRHPGAIRSLTLIDPDILQALPDLHDCPTYRRNLHLTAQATALTDRRQSTAAAQRVIDYWMGPAAWAKTAPRLQTRFAAAMPALVAEWRVQAANPLCLLGLATTRCPIQVIIGRSAPPCVRGLCQVLRLAPPATTLTVLPGAHGACHLTHPHRVGPMLRNFIVCNHFEWQTLDQQQAA